MYLNSEGKAETPERVRMRMEASREVGRSYATGRDSTGVKLGPPFSAFGWEAGKMHPKLKMVEGADEANCRS